MKVRITETTHHGDLHSVRYWTMTDALGVRDFLAASPYNAGAAALEATLTAHTRDILDGVVSLPGVSLEFGWATYMLTRLD